MNILLLLSMVNSSVLLSQSNFEFSLLAQQMLGDKSSFPGINGPLEFTIENFWGYGFQSGLNIGRFNIGLDFIFGSSQFNSATNFDMKITCVDINFEYKFLKKAISPLLAAGIGSVSYNESFISAEGLNESDFSYNVGAGIKWIIAKKFYLKPMYRLTFSKIKESNEGLDYKGLGLCIGFILHTRDSFRK